MATYRLDTDEFIIDGYSHTRPFASFLPGIAGVWGIPMWAFYVNRGQAIAGFGVQDKDHPIMEFLPANRAYRSVPLQGFRTFVKLDTNRGGAFYEPFQASDPRSRTSCVQRMRIRMHDLILEDVNHHLGLECRVQYFTIPHEPFAALARVLTVTNRSRRAMDIQLLDGLPVLIPHGMLDRFLKNMSRTIEAWVSVKNLERRAPFYQLKVEPHDRPEVVPIHEGNFFVAFSMTDAQRPALLEPIVDPTAVFGYREDFGIPERFLSSAFRVPTRQLGSEKTPCAMGYLRRRLAPQHACAVYACFGHAGSVAELNRSLPILLDPEFFSRKARENRALIDEVTRPISTASRSRAFDLYCRQTFLDNVLRGGTPITFEPARTTRQPQPRKVHYVYCRKHGDLERDYNHFVIPATHFSQGNANYRDVNQNRRSDAWFHPEIDDSNVIAFFNLIQTDGFNPLIFRGFRYTVKDRERGLAPFREVLSKPFTPGELIRHVQQRGLKSGEPIEAWLNRVMQLAQPTEDAEHGEGFWTDHWTYNLDVLESYLALHPERLRELLLQRRVFTFYDNPFVVAPRAHKYQVVNRAVRQYHAVRRDPEKAALIQSRAEEPHKVRTNHGRGAIYTTTLLVKMLCVVVNKLASLDPQGIGIEMEADKPNWYDALNGLPGLFGSSICETLELSRWIAFLRNALEDLRLNGTTRIAIPEELREFLAQIRDCLGAADSRYWRASGNAKERYREQTRLGLSGTEQTLSLSELSAFLRRASAKLARGIAKAYDATTGLYRSYFSYEITAYDQTNDSSRSVRPTKWTRHNLPPFLEGMVHAMRAAPNVRRAKALHRAVRRSALYDRGLAMYRVCAPLTHEPPEIGRCQVFNPGWLENQSIWLHMEYKYLLELLRSGLYEEFYRDFFRVLIPFHPPARYGRSILENSSFLVSSAYADASLHGAGFVARLSGATAEFLQMWLWMTVGRKPFRLDANGNLELRLTPALSKELFDAKARFAFCFLGRIRVTYHNPRRRSTFGPRAARPNRIRLHPQSGPPIELTGSLIPHPYALMVRNRDIVRIDVDLLPN